MSKQNENRPGYKKTKVGWIPEEWYCIPFGNITCNSQYGLSLSSSEDGNVQIIGMSNLQEGKIILEDTQKVRISNDEYEKFRIKKYDLIFNRTNSLALVGKTALATGNIECVFASYLVRFTLNKSSIHPLFVVYYFKQYDAITRLKALATPGVSQYNINPTILQKHFYLPVPTLSEQKKIAEILFAWDQTIEKNEKLIEAKERRYAWMLSKLICNKGHTRGHIRDFTSEVSKRNRDTTLELVLSVTNHSGFVLPEDQFKRRVASSNLCNYKVVSKGQYAYNPSRINVGSIARLDNWGKGVLSPMYVVFKINEKKVSSDFFLHWLSSHEAKERIRKSAQGSVRDTVSFTDFAAIQFPMPSLGDQERIVDTLNTARQEIDLLKNLVKAYRKQKRSLMQKLLTGKWRVTDIEVVTI